MSTLHLGTAIIDISPPFPVPLAGFAMRSGDCTGTARKLYARASLFIQYGHTGEPAEKALLVQADIIWWAPERVGPLADKLGQTWGIAPDRIVFHASHTHGGPQTTGRFNEKIGAPRSDYVDFLEARVEQLVAEAHRNVEPVQLFIGKGHCDDISINRRLAKNGTIVMGPNHEGVNDTEVMVVRCETAAGDTKRILFHFACHPTTSVNNLVTSEYCGAAMEALDRQYGTGTSCFLQGCCGDIRPALHRDGAFYSGDENDIERHGNRLAEAVVRIVQQPMTPLDRMPIASAAAQVELPFARVPSMEELAVRADDSELVAAWKRLLASDAAYLRPAAPLRLQLLQIAGGLALLAIDGEVVVEYGLRIKRLTQGAVLPLPYSNGMVGYIPTARQIEEGGYESNSSMFVFGYPAPFSPEIEQRIDSAVDRLMAQLHK